MGPARWASSMKKTRGMRAWLSRSPFGAARLRAYWLTPPGVAIMIATAVAIGLRLFNLLRPGYLTGVTEYDDGVYLGGSLRLIEGQLPYKDFAFIQPPGILLLMTPVALVAKIFTTVKGLALARVLTVVASAACVPLAGNLVRYRGTVVTVVTCGVLAVYPGDVTAAHTLLLAAGIPLATGLRDLRDGQEHAKLGIIIDDIVSSIESGASLSAAFAIYENDAQK